MRPVDMGLMFVLFALHISDEPHLSVLEYSGLPVTWSLL